MPTQIPKPMPVPDYGSNCSSCEGILWPVGRTPSQVLAIFRDLVKCPGAKNPPNNHVFVLDQVPLQPCEFETIDTVAFTNWHVLWDAEASSLLLADAAPPVVSYFTSTLAPCAWRFWQNTRSCPADGAQGGTAIIVPLNSSLCQIIAQLYGLDTNTPAFYDSHSEDIDHTRFSLGIRHGRTRCKIQLDDEFVDYGWPLT